MSEKRFVGTFIEYLFESKIGDILEIYLLGDKQNNLFKVGDISYIFH